MNRYTGRTALIYRKGLKRDGTHPTWISADGSYGLAAYTPTFAGRTLALVDAGAIVGYANVRGGGITVGRAMTERPELFAAVVDGVGWSNPLRYVAEQNGHGVGSTCAQQDREAADTCAFLLWQLRPRA